MQFYLAYCQEVVAYCYSSIVLNTDIIQATVWRRQGRQVFIIVGIKL